MPHSNPPAVCFVGPSNSGKTTLVARLIAHLTAAGLRLGALKHSAHGFQMDREGKDTFKFRAAGARAIAIASGTERAVIATTDEPMTLDEALATLPADLDGVLVEGYKTYGAPKLAVRRCTGEPNLGDDERQNLLALATDDPAAMRRHLPDLTIFHIDDVEAIAELVRAQF